MTSKDQSVESLKAFKIDNATVGITWKLPKYFNQSCYSHIVLNWWTALSNSSYEEKHLELDKTQISLSGLDQDLTYYVQVNLIAPLNVQVYGHTLRFNLAELEYGSFPPKLESDLEKKNSDSTFSAVPKPIVIVIISLVLVFICIILVVCVVKWRKPFKT